MMQFDLTNNETAALAQLLRRTIDDYHCSLSPQLASFKAILAKLDPPETSATAESVTWRDLRRQQARWRG